MVNEEYLKIIKQGVEPWNQWRRENPHIQPDLREVDLRSEILAGANLSKTMLHNADLSGSNLSGASLDKAFLIGANLTKANLSNVDLSDTVLADDNHSADLTNANLRNTIFTPEGGPIGKASFLDLSSCIGLETANFKQGFLQNYLSKAFEYAHKTETYEARTWPNFLDNAVKNIKALQSLYTDQQPPKQLIKVVDVITPELINYLKKHPKAMYKIKPRQFEKLIAEVLASYGWDIQLTPAIKDGGYDIFAISKDQAGMQTSWIIECKKYAAENKVGIDIVRALYGVKSDLKV